MAAYVESNVFSPGDEIVHNGEQLAGVLIISRGIAEALDVNKRNKVTKVLKRGDYWGLHSLFMDSASESLVKAKVRLGNRDQFHASNPRFQRHYLNQAIDKYMVIRSLFKYVKVSMKLHPSLSLTKS